MRLTYVIPIAVVLILIAIVFKQCREQEAAASNVITSSSTRLEKLIELSASGSMQLE